MSKIFLHLDFGSVKQSLNKIENIQFEPAFKKSVYITQIYTQLSSISNAEKLVVRNILAYNCILCLEKICEKDSTYIHFISLILCISATVYYEYKKVNVQTLSEYIVAHFICLLTT